MTFFNQNFYSPKLPVITIKFKLIWVLVNLTKAINFLFSNYRLLLSNIWITKSLYYSFNTLNLLFSNLDYVIFKKILKPVRTFWTVNLYKSIRYWLVNIFLLTNKTVFLTPNQLILKPRRFLNQYYKNFFLSNISLSQKFYRQFLMNILLFILYPWARFNKSFVLTRRFLVINTNYKMFKYYNVYFFKVFNY